MVCQFFKELIRGIPCPSVADKVCERKITKLATDLHRLSRIGFR